MINNEQQIIELTITQAFANQAAGLMASNKENIAQAIDAAIFEGSDILSFPMMSLAGGDLTQPPSVVDNKAVVLQLESIAEYASYMDPNLIISIGHAWSIPHSELGLKDTDNGLLRTADNEISAVFNVQSIISRGRVYAMTVQGNHDKAGTVYSEWQFETLHKVGGQNETIEIPLGDSHNRTGLFGRPVLHVTNGDIGINLAQLIGADKNVYFDRINRFNENMFGSLRKTEGYYSDYVGSGEGLVLLAPNVAPANDEDLIEQHKVNEAISQHACLVVDTQGSKIRLDDQRLSGVYHGASSLAQHGEIITLYADMSSQGLTTTTHTVRVLAAPASTQDYAHADLPHNFVVPRNNIVPFLPSGGLRTPSLTKV